MATHPTSSGHPGRLPRTGDHDPPASHRNSPARSFPAALGTSGQAAGKTRMIGVKSTSGSRRTRANLVSQILPPFSNSNSENSRGPACNSKVDGVQAADGGGADCSCTESVPAGVRRPGPPRSCRLSIPTHHVNDSCPLRVPTAHQTSRSTVLPTNRTAPSPIATWTPWGCRLVAETAYG